MNLIMSLHIVFLKNMRFILQIRERAAFIIRINKIISSNAIDG